ncbi:MAG: UAA transporter family [uncultured bacterium]|nr:MAG: UAA transporter family [uncultured bacterium]
MNPHRLHAYILLLIVTVIWGAASSVIKFTLEGIGPVSFLVYRFAISSLVALFAVKSIINIFHHIKSGKEWLGIILFCFLSTTFALGFLFLGLEKTTVVNSSLLTLAGPLLTILAGEFFLKEHITHREKIGISIAFAGTLLTLIEPIIESNGKIGNFEGNLLIILYLVGDITSVIFLKKIIRNNVSPYALTHLSFVIGFLTILPIYFLAYKPTEIFTLLANMDIKYHLGVAYMALLSGTLAYSLRARAQKTIEVGEASLFTYLTSIVSIPFAVIWLKESLTPIYILGAIVIAVGVSIAEYKWRTKNN